jgi:hypothetical protein
MRDHASLEDRILKLGPAFHQVRQRLQGKLKRDLSDAAAGFIEKYGLPPMDRLERRTLEGILSWFCKYNVLSLLDKDDERKLGIIPPESEDPLGKNGVLAEEGSDDLFGPSKDDDSSMDDSPDAMKLTDF